MVDSHLIFIFCVSSYREDLLALYEDAQLLKAHFSARVCWLSFDELDETLSANLERDQIELFQGGDLTMLEEYFRERFK